MVLMLNKVSDVQRRSAFQPPNEVNNQTDILKKKLQAGVLVKK